MTKGKVISIMRTSDNIEPPDGYTVNTPFGHLSIDDTKAVRLARLGDVLRWIEDGHEWPREAALKYLLDRLPSDAMSHVYRIQPGSFARQVSEVDNFGFPTARQLSEANITNRMRAAESQGLGSPEWRAEFSREAPTPRPAEHRQVSEPGLPALRLLLTASWSNPVARDNRTRADACTTSMHGAKWQANYIAVPLSMAFKWWGYGRLAGVGCSSNNALQPDATAMQLSEYWQLLSDELRTDWLNVLAQRANREAGRKGVRWTPFQVVTAAMVVQAINLDMPGKGLAMAANALGFKAVESLREKLSDETVEKARRALDAERNGRVGKRNTWLG